MFEDKRLLAATESKESWESLRVTVSNQVLLHRDNVIYTPHIAFYSKEAVIRILDTTVRNIRSFFTGTLENIVN